MGGGVGGVGRVEEIGFFAAGACKAWGVKCWTVRGTEGRCG